jgi:shikimate kinase
VLESRLLVIFWREVRTDMIVLVILHLSFNLMQAFVILVAPISSFCLTGMGNYNFLDTDQIIEKATGMSIPEIFASEGEKGFRDVESQVLDSVHPYVRCVISTGGGIVCRRENWSKLQTGLVVWIDVSPELIYDRIKGSDRPLLQTNDPLQTLRDLLNQRMEWYRQADIRIEVTASMSENDVADRIIRTLHDFIDDNPPAWKLAKEKAKAEGLDWVK